jgi:hypothetical protein
MVWGIGSIACSAKLTVQSIDKTIDARICCAVTAFMCFSDSLVFFRIAIDDMSALVYRSTSKGEISPRSKIIVAGANIRWALRHY